MQTKGSFFLCISFPPKQISPFNSITSYAIHFHENKQAYLIHLLSVYFNFYVDLLNSHVYANWFRCSVLIHLSKFGFLTSITLPCGCGWFSPKYRQMFLYAKV